PGDSGAIPAEMDEQAIQQRNAIKHAPSLEAAWSAEKPAFELRLLWKIRATTPELSPKSAEELARLSARCRTSGSNPTTVGGNGILVGLLLPEEQSATVSVSATQVATQVRLDAPIGDTVTPDAQSRAIGQAVEPDSPQRVRASAVAAVRLEGTSGEPGAGGWNAPDGIVLSTAAAARFATVAPSLREVTSDRDQAPASIDRYNRAEDGGASSSSADTGASVSNAQFDMAAGRLLQAAEVALLRRRGITPEYLRRMLGLGYGRTSLWDLVYLHRRHVCPPYVEGMQGVGFQGLQPCDLARMEQYGVTPELVRDYAKAGYGCLTVEQLITLSHFAITPDAIRGLIRQGCRHPSVGQLLEWRLHGVMPGDA
ncbi:MAG TPA: hypothetical protein VGS41_13555, partial [Chthonomonadales bacterium]|nr:hypothetical protein [Chthonomonadales bacterium]